MNSVLIRYHEIALKKGNRPYFTELLKRNILAAVKDLGAKEIRSLPARLLLTFKHDVEVDVAIKRISSVFGVANFSLVERTTETLTRCALAFLPRSTATILNPFASRPSVATRLFRSLPPKLIVSSVPR